MNPFFIEQMAMYSAYHRDARNRATHFIGIPSIVFSLFIPLSWASVGQAGGMAITGAMLLWAATGLFYLWLDRAIGLGMVIVAALLLWAGQWVAGFGSVIGWSVFAIAFVGGWVFQLVGHVFEGRRPALADNLLQALIGPMFLVAETVFAAGMKHDLHEAVEARWKHYSVGAVQARAAGAN